MIIITFKIFKKIDDDDNYIKNILKDYDDNYIENIQRDRWDYLDQKVLKGIGANT